MNIPICVLCKNREIGKLIWGLDFPGFPCGISMKIAEFNWKKGNIRDVCWEKSESPKQEHKRNKEVFWEQNSAALFLSWEKTSR